MMARGAELRLGQQEYRCQGHQGERTDGAGRLAGRLELPAVFDLASIGWSQTAGNAIPDILDHAADERPATFAWTTLLR